jgi:CBS domain-containing protein
MLSSIRVKDYMAANLVSFSPETDILTAVHALVKNRISGAPVLDEHGNLLGMLSERDCIKVALDAGYYSEAGGKVAEYMTADVRTIESDMSILELAELFLKESYRRFPVVEDNRLVGQVSIRDVLRALEVISSPEAHQKHPANF